MKTREIIQSEAIDALVKNNYYGTIVLSVGTGKSYVAIECIKKGNFKNILITSPRTNLKENWEKELEKWGQSWLFGDTHKIIIENIQTCYKWTKEQLKQFDLIIYDEIHTCGEEYAALLSNASFSNIPVIGLTGTPNVSDDFKKAVLYNMVPIVYQYLESEKDGIVNKIHYWIYEYELSDNFKVLTGTKDKKWFVGEAKQYTYLSDQYEKAKALMFQTGAEGDYFNLALKWMKDGITKEQKEAGRKFFYAVKNRKEFLWNLESSASIALSIKSKILQPKLGKQSGNKVLIFSELTSQASRLSKYSIHSNTGKTVKETETLNKQLLDKFNNGEISELSSCLSLTLGLNMNKANWAINESYSGSDTNAKQKLGRLNRLDKNDIANVVIIRPRNTQMGEAWFENSFGHIPSENCRIIHSINELVL